MKLRALALSVPLCLGASVSGCAYYNGMYNAKHYAKQAERSERAGRISEAVDRWRLSAQHAESLVVRHPNSRWANEAMLVRGRALVHLEAWNDAIGVLDEALRTAPPGERRREALLDLGRANLAIRRYPEALAAFDTAAQSTVASRRAEVLLYRGRTWMAMGHSLEALEDFRASETVDARYERVSASLAVSDTLSAVSYAGSLVAEPFREGLWLRLLNGMGSAGVSGPAGDIVDRLVIRPDVSRGSRARLLLADGDRRLAAGQTEQAAARYRDAMRTVPDSNEARIASVRLVRMDLRAATDTAAMNQARARLAQIALQGGSASDDAADVIRLMARGDSLAAATGAGDAFWFLRAELLRDSLGATMLAASAFAEMATRFPESPWTPKGLFAAIVLGHPEADSLRALMLSRYSGSPYTRIATGTGDDPERFAMLEDSLRVLLAGGAVTEVRAPAPDDVRDAVPASRPVPGQPRPQPVRPVPTTRPTIEP